MSHAPVLAILLPSCAFIWAWASDNAPESSNYALTFDASSVQDQDLDCHADPSAFLLQTQHVQHMQGHENGNSSVFVPLLDVASFLEVDSFSKVQADGYLLKGPSSSIADAAETVLKKPFHSSSAHLSMPRMVQICSRHVVVSILALLSVVGFVVAASRAQGAAECDSQRPRKAIGRAGTSVPLPPVVNRFVMMSFVMVMVNQTIVMPASEGKSHGMGMDLAFSGIIIGAYGIGFVLGLPFFLYCANHSYRLGLLSVGIVSTMGNIMFAVSASPLGVILARMLCGLEGGVLFMNQAIAQRLAQGDGLVSAAAQMTMFPIFGLILGPITASVCQSVAPWAPTEVPPSIFMAIISVIFTFLIFTYFPTNEQCHALADAAGLMTPEAQEASYLQRAPGQERNPIDRAELRCSQLSVVLLSCVSMSRMLQRLFWEAGTLHLLTATYSLGTAAAAALVTTSLLGLLFLPFVVLALKRLVGLSGGLRVMDIVELLGILLMFRIPMSDANSLLVYVIGSSLFSFGNLGQFSFLVPLRAELRIPQVWALSTEGGVFMYTTFQAMGTFLGPIAAREIQQDSCIPAFLECDTQSTIPVFLFMIWVLNLIGKEISIDVLLWQVRRR